MGAILEAWDEDLRRDIAMKVILDRRKKKRRKPAPGTAEEATDAIEEGARIEEIDRSVLARFVEEAQITGQLSHPGIVPVHEIGIGEDGRIYFTMQLVQGRDLESVFARVGASDSEWSLTRALGTLLKACEAVAFAHSKGVIHRDLKPANVMVGDFGEVYVMDWGLARVTGQEDRHDIRPSLDPFGSDGDESASGGESSAGGSSSAGPTSSTSSSQRRRVTTARHDSSGTGDDGLYTHDGDVIGTPAYMAPEQASGRVGEVDERSDVYAVGAMLYRLLSGTAPYVPPGQRRSAAHILGDLNAGPPAPLHPRAVRDHRVAAIVRGVHDVRVQPSGRHPQ